MKYDWFKDRNDRLMHFIVWYNLVILGYHDKRLVYRNFHEEEDNKLITFHPHRPYCKMVFAPLNSKTPRTTFKWFMN